MQYIMFLEINIVQDLIFILYKATFKKEGIMTNNGRWLQEIISRYLALRLLYYQFIFLQPFKIRSCPEDCRWLQEDNQKTQHSVLSCPSLIFDSLARRPTTHESWLASARSGWPAERKPLLWTLSVQHTAALLRKCYAASIFPCSGLSLIVLQWVPLLPWRASPTLGSWIVFYDRV